MNFAKLELQLLLVDYAAKNIILKKLYFWTLSFFLTFLHSWHFTSLIRKKLRESRCSGGLSIFEKQLLMSVSVDQWRGEIGNFNNRFASNLLICTYYFNNIYKIILPVFCFLFIVTVCELFWKYLNTLLKQNKSQKLYLEFYKLLSCLYLAILSNYITWCTSIILLSSDIEINLGAKSSSREYLLICYWDLNCIFLNWNACKGQQPLQGMELKDKELLWSGGGGGFGNLLWRPQMGFAANPQKIFGYLTDLESIQNERLQHKYLLQIVSSLKK